MALDNAAVQDILIKLDADREAYLTTLSRVHETLARALAQNAKATSTPAGARIPHSSSLPFLASPSLPPSFRSHQTRPTSVLDLEAHKKALIFTGEESSESEDDESLFVQDALPKEAFSEDDLKEHMQSYDWSPHSRLILGDLLTDETASVEKALLDGSSHNYADIYEIGSDGAALSTNKDDAKEDIAAAWEGLCIVNGDDKRRQAVGKIATLREPSAVLFGATHLTMGNHFDMDSIFRLLTDESPTKSYMKGALKKDTRHHRSFVFCFKYHTIVEDERLPLPWQKADSDLKSSDSHIPISTCSSIVALSLSGPPSQTLRKKSRRKKEILGHIHDPFAPWRNKHYVNGPEAFLITLLAEYQDASKRLTRINKRIVKLVTPPTNILFDGRLRDKLLFENNEYTYSRRYFWAFQALARLNDEIQAMISAYKETFTEDVWSGEHKFIWPGPASTSSRYSNFRKKMGNLRKLFEAEIKRLEHILALNEREQKDIKALRDHLFSGTSVLESREAVNQARTTVMQGYNIRLLTLVSIFFLPLTFVTSVFGMTNMPPEDSFKPFGIVTAAICVPTYFLIGSVNSPKHASSVFKRIGWIFTLILSGFCLNSDRVLEYERKYKMRRGAPSNDSEPKHFASRSLSAYEETQEKQYVDPRRQSRPNIFGNEPQKLNARPKLGPATRSSIKFDLPSHEKRSPKTKSRGIEKKISDPGPNANSDLVESRGFFRTFSRRLRDRGNSPRKPNGGLV